MKTSKYLACVISKNGEDQRDIQTNKKMSQLNDRDNKITPKTKSPRHECRRLSYFSVIDFISERKPADLFAPEGYSLVPPNGPNL